MAYPLATFLFLSALLWADGATAQEAPKDIVAAAVRDKGYECNDPQDIKADPNDTTPEEEAWIIRCENGAYRVKFMGDQGAEVEPVTE
jgi:hypothetical protein